MLDDHTLRRLVLKLQEAVKAFPYAWLVFFWLTASGRLDRLPQVFAASSDTTIRS
jgi:hypothetical protein